MHFCFYSAITEDTQRIRRRRIGRFVFVSLGWMILCQNALAQQNLFNIPSGTIKRKDEVFFQVGFRPFETLVFEIGTSKE